MAYSLYPPVFGYQRFYLNEGGRENLIGPVYNRHEATPPILRQSFGQIHGNNIVVIGDWNIVQSNNSTVCGSNNVVIGSSTKIHGDSNKITGNFVSVKGHSNLIEGDAATVEGCNNWVVGKYAEVSGNDNNLSRDDANVHGYRNTVAGKKVEPEIDVPPRGSTTDHLSFAKARYETKQQKNHKVVRTRLIEEYPSRTVSNPSWNTNSLANPSPFGGGKNNSNGFSFPSPPSLVGVHSNNTSDENEENNSAIVHLPPIDMIIHTANSLPLSGSDGGPPSPSSASLDYRNIGSFERSMTTTPLEESESVIEDSEIVLTLNGTDRLIAGDGTEPKACCSCNIYEANVLSVCCGKRMLCMSCTRTIYEGKKYGQEDTTCRNCRQFASHLVRVL